MSTVPASIPVMQWAAERSGLSDEKLEARFRKWKLWLAGEAQPTMKQLEDYSRLTHTPFGYFFLPSPPKLVLPVPDFRTLRDDALEEPSPELLDTIFLCQQRQEWYREYAQLHGLAPFTFVGSSKIQMKPEAVAKDIRDTLGISASERQRIPNWTEALRNLVIRAEEAGILVMASSIVGSNSHRKLRVSEFRGFALVDTLAPLIFLNAADSKAAQMFTLAHELAHIWMGESGISDSIAGNIPESRIEKWCNLVAAELLIPLDELRDAHGQGTTISAEIQLLARQFKVSTLVVLRRLFDAGLIDKDTLWESYREELEHIRSLQQSGSGGGDFYRTLGSRTGKRFARAILSSTLEGQTLFQDAFRMLGIRKTSTFYEAVHELGVM